MTEQRDNDVVAPACAFCDSTDTELISLFGQTLLGSQYYCRNCRSVFEVVRWLDPEPDENIQHSTFNIQRSTCEED